MKKLYLLTIFSSLFAQSLYFNAFTDIQKAKRLLNSNPKQADGLFIEAKGYLKQIVQSSISQNEPSSQAILLLGELYLHGWGVNQDPQQAKMLLCSAKMLGNAKANRLIKKNSLSCPQKINIKELAK